MVTDSVSPIPQSSQEETENGLDLLHPGKAFDLLHPGNDDIEKRWGSSCEGWSAQTLAAGLHAGEG